MSEVYWKDGGALKSREEIFRLILSHFTVVKIVNGVAYCICPGHKDDKPSLHISMGDKKIILDCKANCSYRDILAAVGLKPEQLYYDYYNRPENTKRVSKKQYWLEKYSQARYDFHNISTGVCTHTKYRIVDRDGKKQFPQGHYDENNVWIDGLSGVDTSLSVFCNGRIKQLQQAIKQGTLICYAEGEKDCLTLWRYGYISFTCGAVRTFKQAILPYLKDANVIVFGDNDNPGRADADRIAGLINTVGRARVIIPPDVPEKGDITDYMSNHTKEDLQRFIAENTSVTDITVGGPVPKSIPLNLDDVRQMLIYKVEYDKDGNEKSRKLIQSVKNFEIALDNDSRLKGKIKFDEFSQQTYLMGSTPWETSRNNYRAWSSFDDSALFAILQSDYGLNSRNDYFDALKNVAMRNRFHPVRDLLNSLKWDEREHIRGLLPDYLGAEDTEYTYQVWRLWMLGAASRIFQPGCKFDYTVIFQGRQGLGKSTFLQLMALNDGWFNDSLDSLDSDKAAQSLMGSWIIELAELKSLARTAGGVDSVKRFLTATQDKYRVPYERRADIFLRQSVFAGTTNKSDFLQDETGNRRFLIIQTGVHEPKKNLFDPEAMNDIKAAWAEAVHIYKTEKPKLLLPESCRKQAEELQAESMSDDGKIGIIQEYLSDKHRTCAIEIWQKALGEQGRPAKWQASEISNIILGMPEWERIPNPTKFGEYGSQRGFQRKTTNTLPEKDCSSKPGDCSNDFMEISESELSELPFD